MIQTYENSFMIFEEKGICDMCKSKISKYAKLAVNGRVSHPLKICGDCLSKAAGKLKGK